MAYNEYDNFLGNGSGKNHSNGVFGQSEIGGPDYEQLFFIVRGCEWIILAIMIVCRFCLLVRSKTDANI